MFCALFWYVTCMLDYVIWAQVLAALVLKYHAETASSNVWQNLRTHAGEWRAASICTGTGAFLGLWLLTYDSLKCLSYDSMTHMTHSYGSHSCDLWPMVYGSWLVILHSDVCIVIYHDRPQWGLRPAWRRPGSVSIASFRLMMSTACFGFQRDVVWSMVWCLSFSNLKRFLN